MTLVLARRFPRTIRLLADSKLTDDEGGLRSPLTGAIKVVLITAEYCIAYAGVTSAGHQALRGVAGASRDRLSTEYILDRLLRASREDDVEFILASMDKIWKVSSGEIQATSEVAWIGNHEAFAAYQEYFHTRPYLQLTGIPEPQRSARETANRMTDAFDAVLLDRRFPDVDQFRITASSTELMSGFHHLPSAVGFDFQPVSGTKEETSVMRPVAAPGGGYNYVIMTPNVPGVAMVGFHIFQARLGALFTPLTVDEPLLFRDVDSWGFVTAVQREHGVTLQGLHWGESGLTIR